MLGARKVLVQLFSSAISTTDDSDYTHNFV